MINSTAHAAQRKTARTTAKAAKPKKPYKTFPLFPHGNGMWAKKIRGRLFYFGPWANPEAAVAKYDAERDEIYRTGCRPQVSVVAGALTVEGLVNTYLTVKEDLVLNGEYSRSHWLDCRRTGKRMVDEFGRQRAVDSLTPADFDKFRARFAKTLGLHALGKTVQVVRTILKYG